MLTYIFEHIQKLFKIILLMFNVTIFLLSYKKEIRSVKKSSGKQFGENECVVSYCCRFFLSWHETIFLLALNVFRTNFDKNRRFVICLLKQNKALKKFLNDILMCKCD